MAAKYNVEYIAGGNTLDLNYWVSRYRLCFTMNKRSGSGSARFTMMSVIFLLAGATQNSIRVAQV